MRDEKKGGRLAGRKQHSSRNKHARTEFDFISHIKALALKPRIAKTLNSSLIPHPSSLALGIGDDAAVIRQSARQDFVITTDLLVEDIDFRRNWMQPGFLGHKALAVSLSDIAAMGARPRWSLLSIGVPNEIWRSKFVDDFYEGYFELAGQHDMVLIGGDVSRTPERIVVDSIVTGETKHGLAVLRSGARAGDHIFVTGHLGGAAAGLRLLEEGERPAKKVGRAPTRSPIEQLLRRQLRPQPRIAWGALLSEERLATAMIDISDGLSSDLSHLCEASGAGALIDADRIPVDPYLMKLGRDDFDPMSLALNGGEDFELLFTVGPRNLKRLPTKIDGVSITYIGDVTAKESGIRLKEAARIRALKPAGFTHF